jgi:hypothetical protein
VSKALDIEAIKGRAGTVSDLEAQARADMRRAGLPFWPLGDAMLATLADVESLLGLVVELDKERARLCQYAEEQASRRLALEAQLADHEHGPDPLRAAVIGILRADGYEVTEPGKARFADTPDGAALLERFFDGKRIDAAASDMLGEDEPVHPSLAAAERAADMAPLLTDAEREDVIDEPAICPSCEKPLPPDGKCRSPYVDCQEVRVGPKDPPGEPTETLLPPGESVRITSDGRWSGRFAVVETHELGKLPSVVVIAKGASLANAVDVDDVLVVNPDVDEPIAKTGPIDTAPAKPKRAPEPPKLVTEWAPDGRDFDGYAKDLGITVDHVKDLEHMFKVEIGTKTPDMKLARWGGKFKEWAKARLSNQA